MTQKTIHIMTATLTAGDAIGNYCRMLQRIFWKNGFRVLLYADLWDKHSVCKHSREFNVNFNEGDILWYHYSIFSENIKNVLNYKGFTILDYHGVTPSELFHGYSAHLEKLCIKAKDLFNKLSPYVNLTIAHSDFTLQELQAANYRNLLKIPLAVETTRFAISENPAFVNFLKKLQYLLFVGRITPQKSILEMINSFAELQKAFPELLLIIVGEYSYSKEYLDEIKDTIRENGLTEKVILTNKISDNSALKTLFSRALFSLYLSHWETFCVPIVESMYLSTPVLGLAKTAIPEVLGDGGVLVHSHSPKEFSDALKPFLQDKQKYHQLVYKAKKRAELFTEDTLNKNISDLVIPNFQKKTIEPKLAFVVQRYGKEVFGGAEYLSRQMAEHLSKYFSIDVLTTCAVDYHSWGNYYPEGDIEHGKLTIRRFKVFKERDMEAFIEKSEALFKDGVQNISFEASLEWMRFQGPRSTDMLHYIRRNKDNYDYFVFFTYLYYSTVLGLPPVREKAVLIPTAHNEPPIYLKIFHDLFNLPKGIIYLTEAERDFIIRLYRNHNIPSMVAGVGIDVPQNPQGNRFKNKFNIKEPFILYIGRIARSKGCVDLFKYFIEYKKSVSNSVKLILIGKEMISVPEHPDIISLGFLSDQDKENAINAATLLVNPSPFESLSFSVLEAWANETPTFVNASCDVLAEHTLRSNAGDIFLNQDEFVSKLHQLLNNPQKISTMGKKGKQYVQTHYTWNRVEQLYVDFFSELHNQTKYFNR